MLPNSKAAVRPQLDKDSSEDEAESPPSTPEEADDLGNFMPLAQLFKTHPLGSGLGPKIKNLEKKFLQSQAQLSAETIDNNGEASDTTNFVERLFGKLQPELEKYDSMIEDLRTDERKKQAMMEQLKYLKRKLEKRGRTRGVVPEEAEGADKSKRKWQEKERRRQEQRVEDNKKRKSSEVEVYHQQQQLVLRRDDSFVNTKDQHFINWESTKRFLEVFEDNVWHFSPLHPSSTTEESAKAILYSNDYYDEKSAVLALNCHIALALGMYIERDIPIALSLLIPSFPVSSFFLVVVAQVHWSWGTGAEPGSTTCSHGTDSGCSSIPVTTTWQRPYLPCASSALGTSGHTMLFFGGDIC